MSWWCQDPTSPLLAYPVQVLGQLREDTAAQFPIGARMQARCRV